MATSRRSHAKPAPIEARVKVWLEKDGQYVFGFGLSEILKAVRTAGSMKAAAKLLGKSYRHVWARIKEAEEALGEPLVQTRVGGRGTGRSSLTAAAEELVADYDALRRRMFEVVRQEFAERLETCHRPKKDRA
jgi:molybdate transport system regulatory protein